MTPTLIVAHLFVLDFLSPIRIGRKGKQTMYTVDGKQIEVVQKLDDGRYLVYVVRWDDFEDCEIIDEENPVIVSEVFEVPPVKKYAEIIEQKRGEVEKLQTVKDGLMQEIYVLEKDRTAQVEKYKNVLAVKQLENFLDNKITHFVKTQYGKIEIVDIDTALEDKDNYSWKKERKLITLFGRSNGDMAWRINQYSDGSGCYTEVIPCTSKKEALELAQKFIDDYLSDRENIKLYYLGGFLKSADRYNLNVPDWARDLQKESEREAARKNWAAKKLSFEAAQKKLDELSS